MEDIFTIANKNFNSRLIVGTGKYKDFVETANAVKASGAEIVTVAVRRVNIVDKKSLNFKKLRLSFIKRQRPTLPDFTLVPSALLGLTSLFEMGRGGHQCYSHHKILNDIYGNEYI